MPAYVRRTIEQFIREDEARILGSLQEAYAADGFASQYTRQTKAWARVVPQLQRIFVQLLSIRPEAHEWPVLLEYPLYRLRRRIDVVLLAGSLVVVVECKVGAEAFAAEDRRQVEEYALDLRDFHAASYGRTIVPVLWSTDAPASGDTAWPTIKPRDGTVGEVVEVGAGGLLDFLATISLPEGDAKLLGEQWDRSGYKPVPNVIEAATSIFAGHDVRSIANADADNLRVAAMRLLELIEEAHGAS